MLDAIPWNLVDSLISSLVDLGAKPETLVSCSLVPSANVPRRDITLEARSRYVLRIVSIVKTFAQ
jgi:hypothetical protein